MKILKAACPGSKFTGSYIKTSASKLNFLITRSAKNSKHSSRKEKEFMRQPIALYASCNN